MGGEAKENCRHRPLSYWRRHLANISNSRFPVRAVFRLFAALLLVQAITVFGQGSEAKSSSTLTELPPCKAPSKTNRPPWIGIGGVRGPLVVVFKILSGKVEVEGASIAVFDTNCALLEKLTTDDHGQAESHLDPKSYRLNLDWRGQQIGRGFQVVASSKNNRNPLVIHIQVPKEKE